MIGAGRGSDGGPDASNMLKQYLEAGDIRFIGSTTDQESNRYMAQSKGNRAASSRLTSTKPTEEEAIKILEGLQYKYNKFHNVTYRKDALEYAVRASAKYIPTAVCLIRPSTLWMRRVLIWRCIRGTSPAFLRNQGDYPADSYQGLQDRCGCHQG